MVAPDDAFIEQLQILQRRWRGGAGTAGRGIARAEIKFDEVTTGVKTAIWLTPLEAGKYAIHFRGYQSR